MILPEVRIKYNGVNLRLVAPQFRSLDNIKVLEVGIQSIKDRLKANRSEEDGYNKPLTATYKRKKIRAGANPWRDLRLTGSMLDGLKVRYASNTEARADYTGKINRIKAGVENKYHSIRRLLQFSPKDQKNMTVEAEKIFGGAVASIFDKTTRRAVFDRRTTFDRRAA